MSEKMVHVSGRGYGKRAAQLAILDELEQGAEPVSYEGLNYMAQMSFTRETPASFKGEMEDLWRSLQMGRGWPPYEETPREELKRRLNLWLQGTYPGEPINWKGLS